MIQKAWDLLLGWLKSTKAWPKIQIVLVFLSAFIAAEILALRFITEEYGVSPGLPLFVTSYITVRIGMVFAGLALAVFLFSARKKEGERGGMNRMLAWYRTNRMSIFLRFAAMMTIIAVVASGFYFTSPLRLDNIRLVFLEPPRDINRDAFAYLIYEINNRQRHVYFEVDFEPFNPSVLTSKTQERCEADRNPCLSYTAEYSKEFYNGGPVIGITGESLGESFFAQHPGGGNVSVISTFDRKAYSPISDYEYLAFSVVVQSIVIQLDSHGKLPEKVFKPSGVSYGGVFRYSPRKQAIKSLIMAARLSPDEEALLFNRFGPEYMKSCRELLTMEWYHSEKVRNTLSTVFGITEANAR